MPSHVDPTRAQAEAFAATAAAQAEPVFMLNLLRFVEGGGAETYARYAAAIAPCLAAVGGEVTWSGTCAGSVIGPDEAEWDVVAIVRYPTHQAFVDMISSEEFARHHPLRTAALADSRLIPCAEATAASLA
jgi:uncharacterized protein (DUF1330 family)